MASKYLYGTYGHLGESVGSLTQDSGTVAVYFGTAPVNLVRDYAENGVVNTPVRIGSYAEAKQVLGIASDWNKYTLSQAIEAHFNNTNGNIGPIYCVNVLDPDIHRSEDPVSRNLTFSNGSTTFTSEDIILDTFDLEGKIENVDYELSYNFTTHKVTVKSVDPENPITGTIQAAYYTVDTSNIDDGDVIGVSTAEGVKTGIQAAEDIYPKFNAIPNLFMAPGWSEHPAVYKALCTIATKLNGHWDGFVYADLPLTETKVTYTKVNARVSDNPSAMGWYEVTGGSYAVSTDTVVNGSDTYYSRSYVPVQSPEGNPAEAGYYELVNSDYVPTTDTEVVEGKTYFNQLYTIINANRGDNPAQEGWYVINEGVYTESADTAAAADRVYYEKSVETNAIDTIDKAVQWKKANGYTNERSKVFWPKALGTDGGIYSLSALAAVETMRLDDIHNGVPFETCGNKSVPVQKQYFGEDSKNQGFDIQKSDDLTSRGIATCIFWGGNWVLWGDSTAAYEYGTDMDPRDLFDVSMRMLIHLTNRFQRVWFATINKPFTVGMKNTILNQEQKYLDSLVTMGALIGSPTIEFDTVRTTLNEVMQGNFYFNVQTTPTPPLKSATAYVSYSVEGFSAFF